MMFSNKPMQRHTRMPTVAATSAFAGDNTLMMFVTVARYYSDG
jgi:hypothetical protein